MKKHIIYFLAIFFLLFTAQATYGVDVNPALLPGSVEPGRVGQSLRAPIEEARPISPSKVAAPLAQKTPLGTQAEKIRFLLKKIIIEDNTIYSADDLLPLYQSKLNTTISVAELYEITQTITAYYRNNGYILSRAILPPQRIVGGVVHVKIIEGFIDKVSVVGNPRSAKSLIQVYGDKIGQQRPLKIQSMERYLRIANEIPGASVKAVLEPSKETTGASDLNLSSEMKMYGAYASYDNYGTRYEGPREILAGFSLNSMFRAGDSTRLSGATTSNSRELKYGDLNHSTPLGSEGVRLTLDGNYTETQPGFILTNSNILGRAKGAYALVSYPWVRSRQSDFTVQGAFNYLDSSVSVIGTPLYNDRIRNVKLGGIYNFSDRFYGSNLFDLEIYKGLNILGASPPGAIVNVSRAGAHSDATRITLDASRIQALYGRFSGFLLFRGQKAFSQLLATDQYGWGGPQLGRGYDPSELLGDNGVGGTIELRMDVVPGMRLLRNLQFYAYYDLGKIWNINKAIQVAKDSATSTGVGARVLFNPYFSGNVMFTQPLTRVVVAEQIAGNGRAPRLFFSITAAI